MSLRCIVLTLLCVALSWATGVSSAKAQPAPLLPVKRANADEIVHRMNQPISLWFKEMPLNEAIDSITFVSGVPLVLDVKALQKEKIDPETPVTFKVENIAMKNALNLMLTELKLAYVVENDGLKITTAVSQAGKLVPVTYPVGDLVQKMTVAEIVKAAALGKKLEKKDGRAEWLLDIIQNTVAKDTWKSYEGNGTIQYFPLGQALVVHQSSEVHEEIALLLATIRKLNYPLCVDVETRLIQASPKNAKQMRLAMTDMGKNLEDLTSFNRNLGGTDGLPVEIKKYRPLVSMNDKQVQTFTDLARKDRAVKMLQLTNPLMREGEARKMEWEFKGVSGVRCEIQPVFPVEGGVCLNVNLEVWAKADSVERVTRATKLLPLAAGQTAVWDLGETAGWEHLFVLFTPRVGPAEQHGERIFLGELPPITGR